MAIFDRFKKTQPVADSAAAPAPSAAAPNQVPDLGMPPLHDFSDYQKLVDEGHELPLDDPRFQRKLRSERRLRAHGVPTLAWMSFIQGEDEAIIRTEKEVADRAVCLMAMAVKAEVVRDGDWLEFAPNLDAILDGYSVRDHLTAKEHAFHADPAPDLQTNTQFGWRYEAFSTLLWALGFMDELPWPTEICDVPFACGVVRELGPEGFHAHSNLRTPSEILDEADHIYRLHWAVRNAQVNGTFDAPAVEPGVVMERHHTLNWLMSYNGQDWDNVSTDT